MSENKFTPGPWWVTDSGIRDSGGYICHTNPAFHYPGQDERYERELAERAANRHLIAAAPDLLVALELMLLCVDDEGDAGQTPFKQARTAIAKARGES